MRFRDEQVSRDPRFGVGNRMVDYEKYYRLTPDEHRRFRRDMAATTVFAGDCRKRLRDDRLILQPGRDRGEPW